VEVERAMFGAYGGEAAAFATALCWTVTALAFESAGRRIGSLAVNLIRLGIAFVFLTVFLAAVRGHALPDDASAHAWIWLGVSGLVGFTIGDLCLFRAFVVIGARLSLLLMSLVPPLSAVTAWMLMGETLTLRQWAAMAVTVFGVAWVVLERRTGGAGRPSGTPVAGVLLGLGGALGQAVGLALSKFGMGEYHPFAATQIRVLAGFAGFALVFTVIGWWPNVTAAFRDRGAIARTGLGAFFGPFLGVSLSLVAVQHTATGVASTIMALLPVLVIPPAVLVNKERVSRRSVLGAVVAVAGTALLVL
jgi:drug/metabolite transporter (DMT)-like permease